jgi:serine/threonine protein kinase
MSTDAAEWDRIESICTAALERNPAERAAFLDSACGSDVELRREVESLLDQIDNDPGFLEKPIVQLAAVAPPAEPLETQAIGPYRLLRRLGRGGMGDVYLATRDIAGAQETVALKVLRRGVDNDQVLRRFRLERRILAKLDHPNIARLLDAEVAPDGRPYFVMEYVEGLPLTDHCRDYSLSIRERLVLFQTVCGAVHHAHELNVVHRDLKPRNILVTRDGTAKLLDFGVGKVLSGDRAFGSVVVTRADQRLLTPEYGAPEQVRGRPVTPATDVYSLGVMLFEIVTGQHPYLRGGMRLSDAVRAIIDVEPPRPSALGSDVSTDLDDIVLVALRKQASHRYRSAQALSADIRRYLEGRAIRAC